MEELAELMHLYTRLNNWQNPIHRTPISFRFADDSRGIVAIFRGVGENPYRPADALQLTEDVVNSYAALQDQCIPNPLDGSIVFPPQPDGLLEIQTNRVNIMSIAGHLEHRFATERIYNALYIYVGELFSFIMYYDFRLDGIVMPGTSLRAPPSPDVPLRAISILNPAFARGMQVDPRNPTSSRGLRVGSIVNTGHRCWFITAIMVMLPGIQINPLLAFLRIHHDALNRLLEPARFQELRSQVEMVKMFLTLLDLLERNQQAVNLTEFMSVFFSLRTWDRGPYRWFNEDPSYNQGQQDSMEFIQRMMIDTGFMCSEIDNAIRREIPAGLIGQCPNPFERCHLSMTMRIRCGVCNGIRTIHDPMQFLRVHVLEHYPNLSDPSRYLSGWNEDRLPPPCENQGCRDHAVSYLNNALPISVKNRFEVSDFLFVSIARLMDVDLQRIKNGVVKIGPIYLPGQINGNDITYALIPVNAVLRIGAGANAGHYEYATFTYDMETILEGNLEDKTPVVHRCTVIGPYEHQRPWPVQKIKTFAQITENMGGLVTGMLFKRVKTIPGYEEPDRDEMLGYFLQHGYLIDSVRAVAPQSD